MSEMSYGSMFWLPECNLCRVRSSRSSSCRPERSAALDAPGMPKGTSSCGLSRQGERFSMCHLIDGGDPPLCEEPHIVLRPFLFRDTLLGSEPSHFWCHHEVAATGAATRITRAAVARDRRGIALGGARNGSGAAIASWCLRHQ